MKPITLAEATAAFQGEPEWLPFWTFAKKVRPQLYGRALYDAVMRTIYSGMCREMSQLGKNETVVSLNPNYKET